MTVLWTPGTDVTGAGVLAGGSARLRIHVSTTLPNASRSSDSPARYYNLGTIGEYAGSYRDPGSRVIYADQQFQSELANRDGWYYILPVGVAATVYRGVDLSSDIAIATRVYASAAQTLTTGVNTLITFDLENQDPWGMHSPSVNPSRVTIQAPGWYIVGGAVKWVYNAVGVRGAKILRNGVDVLDEVIMVTPADGATPPKLTLETAVYLNSGDYVELQAAQFSGGNLDTAVVVGWLPALWVVKVG